MKSSSRKNDKYKRAINFDLSIDKLKKNYSAANPKGAYKDIKNFLIRNGFEHRQGSGYCSKAELSNMELLHIIDKMFDEMIWLNDCSKKIDITNIGKIYDIKKMYSESRHKRESKPTEKEQNKERNSPQERKSVLQRLEENKKIIAQNTNESKDKIYHREEER